MAQPVVSTRYPRNLTGLRFGRWTVLSLFRIDRNAFWLCRCDCGNESPVCRTSLVKHGSRSCGCLRDEIATKESTTHGMHGSPEYVAWLSIKYRCDNPNSNSHHNYGGRGIAMCDLWRQSFERFLADVGHRPSLKHSIDRFPDTNGNYEPGNVRWATVKEQQRNKRTNRLLTWKGKTQTMTDWAEELGFTVNLIYYRLKKSDSMDDVLGRPRRGWPEPKHALAVACDK
jgi:hypothetical protein